MARGGSGGRGGRGGRNSRGRGAAGRSGTGRGTNVSFGGGVSSRGGRESRRGGATGETGEIGAVGIGSEASKAERAAGTASYSRENRRTGAYNPALSPAMNVSDESAATIQAATGLSEEQYASLTPQEQRNLEIQHVGITGIGALDTALGNIPGVGTAVSIGSAITSSINQQTLDRFGLSEERSALGTLGSVARGFSGTALSAGLALSAGATPSQALTGAITSFSGVGEIASTALSSGLALQSTNFSDLARAPESQTTGGDSVTQFGSDRTVSQASDVPSFASADSFSSQFGQGGESAGDASLGGVSRRRGGSRATRLTTFGGGAPTTIGPKRLGA